MKKVAIIDDDAAERLVLQGLVEETGNTVIAVGSNGAEAIGICRDKRPDTIIMDVKMPVMDGIEAAREISRLCPVPIVLLTASDDEETIKSAVDAGVMAYLLKPVRGEELSPAIELAFTRFKEYRLLKEENLELKSTLQSRKVVEKAKGLLMEKEGLTEEQAFSRIRKISMDRRKSMSEIAEVLIMALEKAPR